jgi:hypothetical protein
MQRRANLAATFLFPSAPQNDHERATGKIEVAFCLDNLVESSSTMEMGGFRSGEMESMQTITTHRVSLINLPDTRPFYTCNCIKLNLTYKIMDGIRIIQ